VRGVADGETVDAVVRVDRVTTEWSVEDGQGRPRLGRGATFPYEAALLMPNQFPIWGRFEDAYSPILAERTHSGFRIVSRHKEIPDAVCGITLRPADQVATSFFAPDYSLSLMDPSGS
jgi:hypothetical protein